MARGEQLPGYAIGPAEEGTRLAPLLESRAKLLAEWADDDSFWPEAH